MKKKMLWSIYLPGGKGTEKTLRVQGLTFEECEMRKNQMENREPGSIFESMPE